MKGMICIFFFKYLCSVCWLLFFFFPFYKRQQQKSGGNFLGSSSKSKLSIKHVTVIDYLT